MNTYIHTYIHTDRQTDRHTYELDNVYTVLFHLKNIQLIKHFHTLIAKAFDPPTQL